MKAFLDKRASEDELFAIVYAKPNKNLDDCIIYILNTVRKSECYGFTEEEIFGMAAHYYEEDTVEIGKSFDCRIVVNHTVELTEEEKQQARKDAIARAHNEAYNSLKRPSQKPQVKQTEANSQPNLFDF